MSSRYNLAMHGADLPAAMGLAILFAAAGGWIARELRQPPLIGYLLAGVALGPHLGLGLVASEEAIETIAEIGLILLLFIIGLEIRLEELARAGPAALTVGLIQVPVCLLLGWLLFGGAAAGMASLYLGAALSLSSTLIVVKILSDLFETTTLAGRITIGVLVLQDIWAILFLAMQPNLKDLRPGGLSLSLLAGGALLGFAFLFCRRGLPWIFRRISRQPELILVTSIAWCFFMAGLAGFFGLSREMGALLAGLAMAAFPYNLDVIAKITGIRDFFLTLFFVALGMKLPPLTGKVLGLGLALAVLVPLSRFLTVFPLLFLMKFGLRNSIVPALHLSQVSEFSLVLVSLGLGYGHIPQEIVSAVIVGLILTALVSTYAILHSAGLAGLFSRIFLRLGLREPAARKTASPEAAAAEAAEADGSAADIFLLGFFREASSFLHLLTQKAPDLKKRIFVVDFNVRRLEELRRDGVAGCYADLAHPDTLKHLPLDRARLIICTVSDSFLKGTSNLRLLRHLRRLCPKATIVPTAERVSDLQQMYREGAGYVLFPRLLAGGHLLEVVKRTLSGELDWIRREQKKEARLR